jgi:hypothetical protein
MQIDRCQNVSVARLDRSVTVDNHVILTKRAGLMG